MDSTKRIRNTTDVQSIQRPLGMRLWRTFGTESYLMVPIVRTSLITSNGTVGVNVIATRTHERQK